MNFIVWILLGEAVVALALVILLLLLLIWIILGKTVVVPSVTVSVEKHEYLHAEAVKITGAVAESGLPQPETEVSVKITGPGDFTADLDPVTTDEEGKYETTYEVPPEAPGGTYTVTATALGTEATTSFTH